MLAASGEPNAGSQTPHLAALKDGRLAGVISIRDVVKAISADQQYTITELEKYISSQELGIRALGLEKETGRRARCPPARLSFRGTGTGAGVSCLIPGP